VVGPVEPLRAGTGAAPDHWVEEGATGPENVERGLKALAAHEDSRSDGRVLLSASDLPFLHADAVRWLLEHAPGDADIVYPVIRRADHEASFPDSPNVWTPLADGHYTGGSVLLVRPAAIERNRASDRAGLRGAEKPARDGLASRPAVRGEVRPRPADRSPRPRRGRRA
jgi:hypothetical protein